MARKVFVTSDMAHDERLIDVAEASPEAALIWPWVITYFDDWGRAEAQPKRIKAQLFPMNDLVSADLIDRSLQLYESHGLIQLYEVGGKSYMAIPAEKWWKYQTHIHKSKRKEDKSRYPAPDQSEVRETPRDSAEGRGIGTKNAPSPSTLPPFHPTKNTLVCSGEPNDTTTPPSGRPKNDYPSDFEMFWEAYPRKKEKRTAFKAWKARLREDKNLSPESLIAAAKHYAEECAAKGTDPEYIKHGSTFLSKSKPFEDYLEGVPHASPRGSPDDDSPGLSAALRSARRRLQESGEEATA